jgi:cellulose synthase/poly-beta-1,6-N-acetylglucosamine synthase-like glycosyltransferase
MAAHNAEGTIASSLDTVLACTGVEAEVIVINDGSSDATADIVAGYGNVIYAEQPHRGKWAALNAGVSLASHAHVVTVDADTLLASDALRILSHALGQADAAAGCLLVQNSDSILGDLQAQEHLRIAAHRRVAGSVDTISGPIAAFRKDVLVRIPFIRSPVEDFEHTILLRKAGASISYEPEAKAFTIMPDSPRAYLRQRVRWSRGTLEGMRRHGLSRKVLARGYLVALADVLVIPACAAAGLYAPLMGLTLLEGGMQILIKRGERAPRYGGAPSFFVQLTVLAAVVLATSAYAYATLRQYGRNSG